MKTTNSKKELVRCYDELKALKAKNADLLHKIETSKQYIAFLQADNDRLRHGL